MSKKESIARYNLIIKKLRKKPASFKEISDYLKFESELQDYNFTVSKRTFQRDLQDIQSLYNIEIQYNFSTRVYCISLDDATFDAHQRMLEAFDTFNALNLTDRLSNHIHFEKRKPLGTENLYGLLHAIKNQQIIHFSYQKYSEKETAWRITEPYALKEFKNRWYVLACDVKDQHIKSFALDRIRELEIKKERFVRPSGFNVNDHFRYSFGITGPNDECPQVVVLSFNAFQGKYIKSMPLHETQHVTVDNDEELRVQLTVFVTHDLIMELLSYGQNVKVLQPESLKKQMRQIYAEALKLY